MHHNQRTEGRKGLVSLQGHLGPDRKRGWEGRVLENLNAKPGGGEGVGAVGVGQGRGGGGFCPVLHGHLRCFAFLSVRLRLHRAGGQKVQGDPAPGQGRPRAPQSRAANTGLTCSQGYCLAHWAGRAAAEAEDPLHSARKIRSSSARAPAVQKAAEPSGVEAR